MRRHLDLGAMTRIQAGDFANATKARSAAK
jgi:hypothetical protein